MTISTTSRKVGPFAGNSVTTVFGWSFKTYNTTDLVVTLKDSTGIESVLVKDVHYSVVLNANQETNPGGQITYPLSGTALPSTQTLTITMAAPETQTTDLIAGGGWVADTVEGRLDYLTALVQQHSEQLARGIKGPVSDPGLMGSLPVVASRAGKFMAFDGSGNPTVSSGSGGGDTSLRSDLADGATAGKGYNLVAITRTASEVSVGVTPVNFIFAEGVVDRYGTNTTPGTTDMSTAINNAELVMNAKANGGVVSFQPGTSYAISSTINHKKNVILDGRNAQIIANGCDAITVGFVSYLDHTQIRDLRITAGTGGSTHNGIGILTTSTDSSVQCYNLTIRDCIISGFNVGINSRTTWHLNVFNNRIENCDRGIVLAGLNILSHIAFNKIVQGTAPGGAGAHTGILLDSFNYAAGGLQPSEGVQINTNYVFGFATCIDVNVANYCNITGCDLAPTQVGINFTSGQLILNIENTYIEVDGAAGVAGIYGRSLGSGPLATRVNIKNVAVGSVGGVSTIGIAINTIGGGGVDQSYITIADCYTFGLPNTDILVQNAGPMWIMRNRCTSSAPTNNINVSSVNNGVVFVEENLCTKAINCASADESAGKVVRRRNIVSGSTLESFDGVWTSPAFNAGDYTANGAMTWTVQVGDVNTLQYTINGKQMTVNFDLSTTTVGGTVNTQLLLKIPAGKTAAKTANVALATLVDNGVSARGRVQTQAGGTNLVILRDDGANWTLATDATYVKGQITFEIQ